MRSCGQAVFWILLFLISYPFSISAKTCCQRNVGSEILFPYDRQSKVYNDMGYIGTDSGWDQVFLDPAYGGGPKLNCPQIAVIEMNPVKPPIIPPHLDYKFSGRYEVSGDGSPPRGYTVTLKVDLVDLAHDTVVKSASSTWTCVPREAGYCLNRRLEETIKLARTFQPLDRLIYDYEAVPEKVGIKFSKEKVSLGEEMDITLYGFQDANGKPSRSWQRILVKAEKGRIVNGTPLEKYHMFEVGKGTVPVRYEAPVQGKGGTDKIRIWNSCIIRPGQDPAPEKEIGHKDIPLLVPEGLLEITYQFHGPKRTMEGVIRISLGKATTSLPIDLNGNRLVYYPIRGVTISKASAFDQEKGIGSGFILYTQALKINLIGEKWPVITQAKTGKVVSIGIPSLLISFKWADGDDGGMTQDCTEPFGEITAGDGLHIAEGSCSRSLQDGTETVRWTLKRF